MHDIAWSAFDDRMILVFAPIRARGTAAAAVLEAGNAATEIPASRTLTEIATDRSHVAQCGRSDRRTRFGEQGVLLANDWIPRELVNADRGADSHTTILFSDRAVSLDRPQVDHSG